MKLALGILLMCTTLAAAAPNGDTVAYRVRKGDTLELIAAEYYGERNHAVFVMVANRILHPRALRPGEVLRIPINRDVATAPGDTLASLAEKHLGDPRRARFLAEFNNLPTDASLAAGMTLSIPLRVTHVAAGQESLASIAAAYYGDSRRATLLRDYNFAVKPALAPQEKLLVPLFHVRARPAKLPPLDGEAKERAERFRRNEAHATVALATAKAAWRSGDYAAVKRTLTTLELDYLNAAQAQDVGVLLAGAYLAFDDPETALATLRIVRARNPRLELSEYASSPKLREVWARTRSAELPKDAP